MITQLHNWDLFKAVIRGKLRLKGATSTNPIAVGDMVILEKTDSNIAVIKEILPRKNYIIRKSTNLSRQSHIIAANLDMVFLIVTVDFPSIKMQFIDIFLVTCEAYHIPVTILINKMDLYDDFNLEKASIMKEIYSNAGYNVIEISAKQQKGSEQIKELCQEKIVLFLGQSGFGQSARTSVV